jgi:hypothetical protein
MLGTQFVRQGVHAVFAPGGQDEIAALLGIEVGKLDAQTG